VTQLPFKKLRLLFLYSELADYFIACLKKLADMYEVEVHVIHWPINKEAPFAFNYPTNIQFYQKDRFSKEELSEKIRSLAPDFIYCSGWMDNDYLLDAKKYSGQIPVVIGLDTKWEGSIRQYGATILSRLTIRNIFSHCWVPGTQQKKYALKLGFKEDEIMMGYYSADVDFFSKLAQRTSEIKNKKYPHRFIYVGRYYDFKGITDLWEAFIQWQKETNSDWELWCLGMGDIPPVQHPKIKHFGFVQPMDLEPYTGQAGVFVMPSRFEPWGVVLHEFAAAGFPLICSDKVGAAEAFLRHGENGYIYPSENVNALKGAIAKAATLSDEKLKEMGNISRQLAAKITPQIWTQTLMSVVQKHK
jgi:glycosyltransferase involved in cell wall biosynthesis